MSKKLLLAAMLVAAGCSQDPAGADSPQATSGDPAAQAVADQPAVPCREDGYSALPEGVRLDQEFYVRSDRVYATRVGAERRRTALELVGGAPRQVAEAVVAQLVSQGFRQMEIPDRGDGIARYAVRKGGVGRINISATDDRGRNPSHPRSVGVIAFDWPFSAAAAEDGAAGAAAQDPDAETSGG